MPSVAGHQAEPRLDVREQPLVRGRIAGEDEGGGDVHVPRRVLQVQERGIEWAEPVSGHLCIPVSSSLLEKAAPPVLPGRMIQSAR
jgi:hypothetical protein